MYRRCERDLSSHQHFQAQASNQTHFLRVCLARQKASTFQASLRQHFLSGKLARTPTKQALGVLEVDCDGRSDYVGGLRWKEEGHGEDGQSTQHGQGDGHGR